MAAAADAGAARALLPVSDEKISFEYKAEALPGGLPDARRRGARLLERHVFGRREARWWPRRCRTRWTSILRELRRKGDELEAYLRFDQHYYLPDDILAKVDRMSMAHSIEVRPPFLDHRIVEFAATLPAHLKIRGSEAEDRAARTDEGQAAAHRCCSGRR